MTRIAMGEEPRGWINLARYIRNPAKYALRVGSRKDLVRFRLGPREFWLVTIPT